MRFFHTGFLALTALALFAVTLPAAAQDAQRPIFNRPGGSGAGTAPYDFAPRTGALDDRSAAIKEQELKARAAQHEAFAARQMEQELARFEKIRQEGVAMSARLNATQGQRPATNASRPAPGSSSPQPRETAGTTGSTPQKKMIYTKPKDETKEPGRLFNLKWR